MIAYNASPHCIVFATSLFPNEIDVNSTNRKKNDSGIVQESVYDNRYYKKKLTKIYNALYKSDTKGYPNIHNKDYKSHNNKQSLIITEGKKQMKKKTYKCLVCVINIIILLLVKQAKTVTL